MKVKILVVGFPRSGTTLTYRVCKKHPQMSGMFNERHILRGKSLPGFQFINKKQIYNRHLKFNLNHGEKIIYEKGVLGKRHLSKVTVVDYCRQWNKTFGKESKIIQVVRHPFDSWNSIIRFKYRTRRKEDQIPRMFEEYLKYIPKYTEAISKLDRCLTIKYENLVLNFKEVVAIIHEHCGLDPFNYSEVPRTGRAFNYRRNGFKLEADPRLSEVIDVFNKFDGPEYKLGDLP